MGKRVERKEKQIGTDESKGRQEEGKANGEKGNDEGKGRKASCKSNNIKTSLYILYSFLISFSSFFVISFSSYFHLLFCVHSSPCKIVSHSVKISSLFFLA